MEVERNLVRMTRENILSQKDYELTSKRFAEDIESFILKDVTLELCLHGRFPAIRTPRSNDLLHLRTALWFQSHGGIDGFITLDKNQSEAAKELGLEVLV